MTSDPLYTLTEAAKVCHTTVASVRKRADRGSIVTTKREDGTRLVAHAELERSGLLAGSEVHRLRRDVARLEEELHAHRQLAASAQAERDAEREGHARVTAEYVEAQARVRVFEDLERELAGAGPIKAWRIARRRRDKGLVTTSDNAVGAVPAS